MRCSRRETSASKLWVVAASFVGVLASAVKLQTSLKDNQVDGPRKDAASADIVGFVRGFKTASARRAQASNTKRRKPPCGGFPFRNEVRAVDQPIANALLRPRPAAARPRPTNPRPSMAQVDSSGTDAIVRLPSATQLLHTPEKPKL